MLTSQVIFLKLKKGNPDKVSGNHVHGFFFKKILATVNPKLADVLHQPDAEKPFSISYVYREGQIYWFRIASWTDEIAQAVFLYFNTHFEIRLNDCLFELIKTSTDKKESLWAERICAADFVHQARAMKKDVIYIEHYSPVSFKRGDSHLPLPVPELIITSINNKVSPEIREMIRIDTIDLLTLSGLIHLKEHRIYSVYNRKNYGSIASFHGRTRWQIDKRANQNEKNALYALFSFAFYSGIGVKTTQGMGMTRLVP